MKVATFAAV